MCVVLYVYVCCMCVLSLRIWFVCVWLHNAVCICVLCVLCMLYVCCVFIVLLFFHKKSKYMLCIKKIIITKCVCVSLCLTHFFYATTNLFVLFRMHLKSHLNMCVGVFKKRIS
eukprot:GHVR01163165.1.p1 GENE.GHVR01163165.1~~GHVR01163165.1.p1  ORF type:complete len:113 (-),score=23.50 GHVR01163165.1:17-355(-)